jgi:Flp pilus assembly pilin Flp
MEILQRFLKDEQGQDLIEYTLLMAFIALALAAIFTSAGGSISGIRGTASIQLAAANTSASQAGAPGHRDHAALEDSTGWITNFS